METNAPTPGGAPERDSLRSQSMNDSSSSRADRVRTSQSYAPGAAPHRGEKKRNSCHGPSTPSKVLSAGLGRSGDKKTAKCSRAANRGILRRKRSLRSQMLQLLDEHTSSRAAMVLHLLFWCIIIMSVVIVCIKSSPRLDTTNTEIIFVTDLAVDTIFTIELLLRIWATGWCHLMVSDPFMYIDLLAITPFIVTIFGMAIGGGRYVNDTLHVLKLVRLLKLARHYEGARVLWGALKLSFEALLVPLYFLLCMVLFFAALLYIVEVRYIYRRTHARAHTHRRKRGEV